MPRVYAKDSSYAKLRIPVVSIIPGATPMTLTPLVPNSFAQDRVKLWLAAFAA